MTKAKAVVGVSAADENHSVQDVLSQLIDVMTQSGYSVQASENSLSTRAAIEFVANTEDAAAIADLIGQVNDSLGNDPGVGVHPEAMFLTSTKHALTARLARNAADIALAILPSNCVGDSCTAFSSIDESCAASDFVAAAHNDPVLREKQLANLARTGWEVLEVY